MLDRRGARHTRTPAEYEIGYRHVRGPADEWFVAARLEFERKPGVNDAAMRELLEQAQADPADRRMELRFGVHQSAGRARGALIESAGLKGFRIGDASVSREARQFHHQSRLGPRRRHRGADPARPAQGRRGPPSRARDRSTHRRGAGMSLLKTQSAARHARASEEFGKVAVLLGGDSTEREISLLSGHAVLERVEAPRRGRARVRSGRAARAGIGERGVRPGVESLCTGRGARTG